MHLKFNPAQICDLDIIHHIQCCSFKPAFHESKDVFAAIINKYPKGCFIIKFGDKAAGYLMSHPDYIGRDNYEDKKPLDGNENTLFIHDLCIAPDFQGQGIAIESVEFIENFARSNNFNSIIGIAITEAQKFWVKHGFIMGHAHPYCGEDARVMSKNLN